MFDLSKTSVSLHIENPLGNGGSLIPASWLRIPLVIIMYVADVEEVYWRPPEGW